MNRKKSHLFIFAIILVSAFVIGGICYGAGSGNLRQQEQPASLTLFAMDTIITIEAYDGDGNRAVEESEELIKKLENLWSVTDENSEIYRANHSQGVFVPVSEETKDLIEYALEMADETEGAFNPAVYPIVKAWGFTTGEYQIPEEKELKELLSHMDYRKVELENGAVLVPEDMEMDFGAVAKGYAGDLITETMRAYGVQSGIMNLGGNVALIGKNPDGNLWKVGIRSPYGEGTIGILEAEDCHIITSGGYERYFIGENGNLYWHILDPEDGMPADSGMISVSVIGDQGRMCDVLSTALFVMGLDRAQEYWRTHEGFEMILITEENEVYVTEGIRNQFQLNEASMGIPVYTIKK